MITEEVVLQPLGSVFGIDDVVLEPATVQET